VLSRACQKKEADWENTNKQGPASMKEEREREREVSLSVSLTITKRSKRRRGVSLLLQKEKVLLT
jgi:hypothetical protein